MTCSMDLRLVTLFGVLQRWYNEDLILSFGVLLVLEEGSMVRVPVVMILH